MILVVAASLGSVFAKDTAFVEVVLFESSPNGHYTTYTTGLQGRFSKAGATISAEGEIVQVRAKCLFFPRAEASRGGGGEQRRRAARPDPGCSFTELPVFKLFPRGAGGAEGGLTRAVCCVCARAHTGSARMVPCCKAYAVTRWLLSCGIHSQGKHAVAG